MPPPPPRPMDPSLTSGASVFRFSRDEVAEMEAVVRRLGGRRVTSAAVYDELARRFTASRELEGKTGVMPKQVIRQSTSISEYFEISPSRMPFPRPNQPWFTRPFLLLGR